MNFDPVELESLAREIACRMDPDALVDAADVGALLKYTARHVTDYLMHQPGFPATVRLSGPDGRKGHPRWRRGDITDYIRRGCRPAEEPRPGRPRRRVD